MKIMAQIIEESFALEKRRDWSELVFGFALNFWDACKNTTGTKFHKPRIDFKSSARCILSANSRIASKTSVICTCACHCSLKPDDPPIAAAEPSVENCDCLGHNGKDKYASQCLCASKPNNELRKSKCLSGNLAKSKSRHHSADHITCIKTIKNRSSGSSLTKSKFRSAGHEKSVCDGCGCDKSCIIDPDQTDTIIGEDNNNDTPSVNCGRDVMELYDKRLGKLVSLEPYSITCDRPNIKQSTSDPSLSTSGNYFSTQNSNNENTSNFLHYNTIDTSKLRGSHSNSSFSYKDKSSLTMRRLNKKNMSFRVSTRNLAKKFVSNKFPERVCPSPGNVKLSAINNLNNKPLELLREQMDGKIVVKHLDSNNISNNGPLLSTVMEDSSSKLRDGSGRPNSSISKLTDKCRSSSLRLGRASFLRHRGSTARVRPSDLRHSNSAVPDGTVDATTTTRYSAWSEEYDDLFDHLHHKSCPCRISATTSPASCKQLKDEMADVTAEMETLDGGEDGKNNPKSKQMSIGRKKFNMDPKKGIEYLIEHGLLKNTPDDISKFLYNGEGLNKTAIGDYLGERHDFNQTVLDAFVALHNFTDLILVQALRQFLWSFRLPGEAQKIDRMMERFAGHYCELNPSIFQHPDTCFVLSFAIIMLNTSLHNPAVKDKQTPEQFINMNRGIDNGDDLPRELLESLYESIKTEPFKIPEDDGNDLMHTFFNPDREGWLWKQGGRYKSWKRRWFILNDNCLYYFEYTTDKEPRGIIPLENIEVREVHDRNKPHCFELYATSTDFIKACKTDSEGKVVEGKHTVYRMSASTHEEKEEWIKCIRQSISHNPFYDLLAKRKKNIQKSNS